MNPQFWTRWVPVAQAGARHRSFRAFAENVPAVWNGFSRPVLSIDISGVKSVAEVVDQGEADPIIPVSVITWHPDDIVENNVHNTEHYMLQKGTAKQLTYIPDYNNQPLKPQARLYFWSAPPLYGAESLTSFDMLIKILGVENPFSSVGYLTEQPTLVMEKTPNLYSTNYPINSISPITFPNPIS